MQVSTLLNLILFAAAASAVPLTKRASDTGAEPVMARPNYRIGTVIPPAYLGPGPVLAPGQAQPVDQGSSEDFIHFDPSKWPKGAGLGPAIVPVRSSGDSGPVSE